MIDRNEAGASLLSCWGGIHTERKPHAKHQEPLTVLAKVDCDGSVWFESLTYTNDIYPDTLCFIICASWLFQTFVKHIPLSCVVCDINGLSPVKWQPGSRTLRETHREWATSCDTDQNHIAHRSSWISFCVFILSHTRVFKILRIESYEKKNTLLGFWIFFLH